MPIWTGNPEGFEADRLFHFDSLMFSVKNILRAKKNVTVTLDGHEAIYESTAAVGMCLVCVFVMCRSWMLMQTACLLHCCQLRWSLQMHAGRQGSGRVVLVRGLGFIAVGIKVSGAAGSNPDNPPPPFQTPKSFRARRCPI